MKDILLIWYSSLTAFFLTLEMSVQIHCFWPPVSDQKSAVSLTEDPRYMLSQFSLAALEILFIIRFQTFEFPYASLWVYLTWSSLRFLGVYVTVSQQLFSHYFLKTFLLLFFFFPLTQLYNVCILQYPAWSLKLCSLQPFHFFCSDSMISTTLSSRSLVLVLWIHLRISQSTVTYSSRIRFMSHYWHVPIVYTSFSWPLNVFH